jgi:hypothetical protein
VDHVWSAVAAHWFAAARQGTPVDCWALWDGGEHLAIGPVKADVESGPTGHLTQLWLRANLTEPNPYEPHRFKLADFLVVHTVGSQTTKTVLGTAEGPEGHTEYEGGIVWTPSTYVAGTAAVDSPTALLVQFRFRLADVLFGPH